jgi:hypothetical protein
LEKIIFGPLYWAGFPFFIHQFGFWAVPTLFLLQTVVFLLMWQLYDYIGRDVFGLEEIKRRINSAGSRLRRRFRWWNRFLERFGGYTRVVEYAFWSWQVVAVLALLCMRRDGKPGRRDKEALMICGSTLFATVYWTLYSVGMINVILRPIKALLHIP